MMERCFFPECAVFQLTHFAVISGNAFCTELFVHFTGSELMQCHLLCHQFHCHGMPVQCLQYGIGVQVRLSLCIVRHHLIQRRFVRQNVYLILRKNAVIIHSGGHQNGARQFCQKVQIPAVASIKIVQQDQMPWRTDLTQYLQFPFQICRITFPVRACTMHNGKIGIAENGVLHAVQKPNKYNGVIFLRIRHSIVLCQFCFSDTADTVEQQELFLLQKGMDLLQFDISSAEVIVAQGQFGLQIGLWLLKRIQKRFDLCQKFRTGGIPLFRIGSQGLSQQLRDHASDFRSSSGKHRVRELRIPYRTISPVLYFRSTAKQQIQQQSAQRIDIGHNADLSAVLL